MPRPGLSSFSRKNSQWKKRLFAPNAWPYMSQLARKYLKEEYGFAYQASLFSMKPILKASEIDDSRPTVVRVMNTEPMLVSVLSGKINTVYDLDEVLNV